MPISRTTTTQLGMRVRLGGVGVFPPPCPLLLLFGDLLPPGGWPDGRLPPPLFGSCIVQLPLFADAIVGPLLASSIDFNMVQRGLQTRMAALLKQRRARTLNPRGNDHISSTRQRAKPDRVRRVYDTFFIANCCGRSARDGCRWFDRCR